MTLLIAIAVIAIVVGGAAWFFHSAQVQIDRIYGTELYEGHDDY